ncbi:MAG: hypothetical protein H6741_33940 [Alphaproteobacteria bacterium]|nr:hypothetical protein [Alphaproteobacteria bacterium]
MLDAMFGKKLRQRSPESVVRELAELRRRFDIEGAWFTDDTFTTNRRWVLGLPCPARPAPGPVLGLHHPGEPHRARPHAHHV